MSRIIIIGGSGHVGSYLVPTLFTMGHEVVNVSRGISVSYRAHSTWEKVESVILDRTAEEAKGEFGTKIVALRPDIVVDMISFNLPSMQQLVEALHGKIDHYLFCSTIWVYGSFTTIPSTEADLPNPIEPYGRNKAEMEAWPGGTGASQRLSGSELPTCSHRRGRLVADQSAGESESRGVLKNCSRRGTGVAQLGAGDDAPCSCRRRRSLDSLRHSLSTGDNRGSIQHCLRAGAYT